MTRLNNPVLLAPAASMDSARTATTKSNLDRKVLQSSIRPIMPQLRFLME